MMWKQLLLFTAAQTALAFMAPRGVPRVEVARLQRAIAATRLHSMEEDADDFPSDSAVPDEPEPEPTGDEADAPSDVDDPLAEEDCVVPEVEPWKEEMALDAETELLDRCLGVNRGATASDADRADVERLARSLEALAPLLNLCQLEGVWSLVYSSEPGLYRSSPFFWSFSRLLEGKASPTPVPGAKNGDLAEAVYAVTDALGPFYTVGDATQTITSTQLVSEVELSIEPLPNLPPVGRSLMTSTAFATATPNGLELTLEKTEVKDSTISQLPGLGFLDALAFPTKNAFEALSNALQLTPDASTVQLLATYVSDGVRVTRTEGGYLFVHERAY